MKKLYLIIFTLAFLGSCREDTIDLQTYGQLIGEVLDADSLVPITGVNVTTNPETDLVSTDEFGEFTIDSLLEGSYSIRGRLSGYEDAVISVQIEGDRINTVKILMSRDLTVNTPPALPSAPQPANGTQGADPNLTLSWSSSDANGDDLSYDVYLFTSDTSNNAIPLALGITDTFLNVSNMGFDKKYFWQVVVSDGVNTPVYGEVWNFSIKEYPRDEYRFTFVRPVNNVLTLFGGKAPIGQNEGELSYQLTNGMQPYWKPRLRPILRDEMAALHLEGPDVHIYVMERDGTLPVKVTNSVPLKSKDEKLASYCWSPAGDQLMYMNFGRLYRINKDGSGLRLAAEADDGFVFTGVDWTSLNNGTIVATAERLDNNESKIYHFQLDSVPRELQNFPLTGQGLFRDPVFDPSGRKIAFSYNWSGDFSADGRPMNMRVYVFELDGSLLDLSTTANKEDGTNDVQPRFINGGAKVLFVNKPFDNIGPFNVWVMDVDPQGQNLNRTLLFENADMPDWN